MTRRKNWKDQEDDQIRYHLPSSPRIRIHSNEQRYHHLRIQLWKRHLKQVQYHYSKPPRTRDQIVVVPSYQARRGLTVRVLRMYTSQRVIGLQRGRLYWDLGLGQGRGPKSIRMGLELDSVVRLRIWAGGGRVLRLRSGEGKQTRWDRVRMARL